MKASVSIIIPTFNQPKALYNTLYSIIRWTKSAYRIYVVDNSIDKYAKSICDSLSSDIAVIKSERNFGWMGGINLGVANSHEDYLLFLNDDIRILNYDGLWLQKMLETFLKVSDVGAVVPTSNNVMGYQSIINESNGVFEIVPFVSGLCFLTSRKIFNRVGELDEHLSGGDDLDYSIRLRDSGYNLVIRSDVFIYHFGSLTGKSIYGSYWDSNDYTSKLQADLIRKHGFKKFLNAFKLDVSKIRKLKLDIEWEKQAILKYCIGKGVEIGCGGNKIVDDIVGVDITPKDSRGIAGCQIGRKSQADITVTDYKLPFKDNEFEYLVARHVLEHIVDDMAALREWVRVLKHGSLMTIAVPDEEYVDGMPLDPTHKHTYTVESLKNKLNYVCNFEVIEIIQKDISFVMSIRIMK